MRPFALLLPGAQGKRPHLRRIHHRGQGTDLEIAPGALDLVQAERGLHPPILDRHEVAQVLQLRLGDLVGHQVEEVQGGAPVCAARRRRHPEQQRVAVALVVEVLDDLDPARGQRPVTLVADDQREQLRPVRILALAERLDGGNDHLRGRVGAPLSLIDADRKSRKMLLELLGRLVQELPAVGDEQDLARVDQRQQPLDDQCGDDRLARARGQVQQHLARTVRVEGEHLPDGLFLVGARQEPLGSSAHDVNLNGNPKLQRKRQPDRGATHTTMATLASATTFVWSLKRGRHASQVSTQTCPWAWPD